MRSVRVLKLVLVICIGLQAAFYAISNLVNLESAFQAVAYVLSMAEQTVYSDALPPPITAPALIAIALTCIIATEAAIGVLCFAGAQRMWAQRNASTADFQRARRLAVLGCGLGLVLWIGGFMAFGGALFQMWQTPIGIASLEGAFMYAMSSAAVLLFVNQPEGEQAV